MKSKQNSSSFKAIKTSEIPETSKTSKSQQQELRQNLRQSRQQLSAEQQQQHANQAVQQFVASEFFPTAQKIAVFFAADGELPTNQLIETLWQAGKQVFLPRVLAANQMEFVEYLASGKLVANQFGILEPAQPGLVIAANQLDLVLVPLVGFDLVGNRLGMGGGFYDRTFGFKNQQAPAEKPYLIGWAHSLQQVAELATNWWDVQLDAVITEQQTLRFK